ncbi:hypothetical protein [Halobaculum lipolyticum]|uniref:Uncharacterized protein n=1 Tax=Halobaculum lipolyticum TaxID=3032001 RepID=A0ABD5WCK6_9EURY|nr:hypothetical protein [Halobaculum sp. DT31]
MTDHTALDARPPLGSGASGAWSVVASVAARTVAFLGEANRTGAIGAATGVAAPAYVPSVSIAA